MSLSFLKSIGVWSLFALSGSMLGVVFIGQHVLVHVFVPALLIGLFILYASLKFKRFLTYWEFLLSSSIMSLIITLGLWLDFFELNIYEFAYQFQYFWIAFVYYLLSTSILYGLVVLIKTLAKR